MAFDYFKGIRLCVNLIFQHHYFMLNYNCFSIFKQYATMYLKKSIRFFCFLTIIFYFLSCQKDNVTSIIPVVDTDTLSTLPPLDLDITTKINTTVSGFVTDDNDLAVIGATVTVGTSNTVTDKYGFFEIKNALVIKEIALVKVDHPDYFKATKSFIAQSGKSAFFRIKLLPTTYIGSIDINKGGNLIQYATGFIISLPAKAILNAATNLPVEGWVDIKAKWIDPTDPATSRTMPGDLRGIDTNRQTRLLASYGMVAIELRSPSGELLKLKPGKKATLTFPIAPTLLASAPSEIPLWYFDETLGLWRQQGKAVKNGNNYIGDVSHFSFWNCDISSNFVKFNCTVTDQSGNPLPNTLVKISAVDNPQYAANDYTDTSGYVGGLIPQNKQLLLEVYDFYCPTPIFSQQINSGTTDISFGTIVVPPNQVALITGNIVNCNNLPVTDGYILLFGKGVFSRYPVDNLGNFKIHSSICTNSLLLLANDNGLSQSGLPLSLSLTPGLNNIGTISACGVSTQQFIKYTLDGVETYSLIQIGGSSTSIFGAYYFLEIYNYKIINFTDGNEVRLLTNLAIGENTEYLIASPIQVYITEDGGPGQFLAGYFSGTVLRDRLHATTVSCSFRVRRNS